MYMSNNYGYKFINHIADVEFVATGKEITEAISNSILAMSETSANIKALKNSRLPDHIIHIQSKSDNLTDLAWNILQLILSETESRNIFCYSIKSIGVEKLNGIFIVTTTLKCKKKSEKYYLLEVKGVSRYGISMVHKEGMFKIHIVLDV